MSENHVYVVGGKRFKVLFPDLMPPLKPEDYAGLKASIESDGIQYPIKVDGFHGSVTEEEYFGVIDGEHRLKVAVELGLEEVPYDEFRAEDENAKRIMALSLNEDRRQLTQEDRVALRKLRVAKIAELRQEGASLSTIAEEVGVSKTQVHADLQDAKSAPQNFGLTAAPAPPAVVQKSTTGTYPAERPITKAQVIKKLFDKADAAVGVLLRVVDDLDRDGLGHFGPEDAGKLASKDFRAAIETVGVHLLTWKSLQ